VNPKSARALLLLGSTVRIAYGLGSLLTPTKMVNAQFAPDTHDLADPRLLLRAFGGHQVVTSCVTFASVRSPAHARSAATLSLLIDTFDVACALLERRTRGANDQSIAGGIAISGTGMLTFGAALWGLSR
jgi:hypothetical protein